MDVNDIIDKYLDMQKRETEQREEISYRSAEGFNIQQPTDAKDYKDDVLVIDRNLKGLDLRWPNAVTRFTVTKCSDLSASTAVSRFTVVTARMPRKCVPASPTAS